MLVWFGLKARPFVRQRRKTRREQFLASERFVYQKLKSAVAKSDEKRIFELIGVWQSRLGEFDTPRALFSKYGSARLLTLYDDLGNGLYGNKSSVELDTSRLMIELDHCRAHFLTESVRSRQFVPPLNPVSSVGSIQP